MASGHTNLAVSSNHPDQPRSPPPVPKSGELIRTIGECMFGTRWITELSQELGVSARSVRRWATGRCEPSPEIWVDLSQLLAMRAHEQMRLRDRIHRQKPDVFRLYQVA
jgi:hypothetical protein